MALPAGTIGTLHLEVDDPDLAVCEDYARKHAEHMGVDPLRIYESDKQRRPNQGHRMRIDYDCSGFPEMYEWLVEPSGQRHYVITRPGTLTTNGCMTQREVGEGLTRIGHHNESMNAVMRKLKHEGWRVEK